MHESEKGNRAALRAAIRDDLRRSREADVNGDDAELLALVQGIERNATELRKHVEALGPL